MKKISYVLLVAMLVVAMFVSCKAEVIDDADLVGIRFVSEDNGKGLTWSRPGFDASGYKWYYTAEKADEGPKTGETMTAKLVGENGNLSEDTGPLSQGKWKFVLFGYNSGNVLVYKGSVETTISKSSNSVTVVVSAQTSGNGYIHISKDIHFNDDSGKSFAPTAVNVLTVSGSDVTSDTFNSDNGNTFELASGAYKVVVYRKVDEITYASNTIYVNVYDGQTTTIGGTLDESTTSAKFVAEDGTVTATSNATYVSDTGDTMLEVGATPINANKTSVSFPFGTLEAGKNAVLKVVAYPTSVAKTFSVLSAEDVPVSGIDLSVTVDGTEVKNFGSAVTVTTYVTKNLTSDPIGSAAGAVTAGLKVVYNGDGAQPEIVSYNPESGKLVFTTTHFSQYYVTSSNVEAVDATHNDAILSLEDALSYASDYSRSTIILLKDIENFFAKLESVSNLVIDLNGHNIEGSGAVVFDVFGSLMLPSNITFTGKGVISNSVGDNIVFQIRDNCELTIDGGVTLKGSYGVLIDKSRSGSYLNKYAVVSFKGTIDVDNGFGLYINGDNEYTGDDAPVFVLDGAKINVENGSGIYGAGYARWIIKDTDIVSNKTAIEIRAGELNIDGCSFEATASSYECTPNGNGTTTVGAAIAVAQHTTGLPINVSIKNTALEGYHGLAVENPQDNKYEALSKIRVEFDSSVVNPHFDSAYFVNEGNVIIAKKILK